MKAGPMEKVIREKLSSLLAPSVLDITNESPMHGLPREAEKHFRVVVVSEVFNALSRVDRQRMIYTALADEMKEQIHALSLQAFSPEEWRARGGATFDSPECRGGGKKDR